tara:strand:- start:358 stop:714 length:357 start_codon:yes stop_codon:yes gene_type:complete
MKFFLSVLFVLVGLTSCNQESEWIYLFDGETTNGWRGYNAEVMPPGWTATEGTLTFNTENRLESEYIGGRDIIYENEEFENFLNFMLNGNWEKEVIAAFCIMLKKDIMHLMKPLQNTN